jgi:hypothetical protein
LDEGGTSGLVIDNLTTAASTQTLSVPKFMDWKLFAQLVVTFLVAVLGWWIGHGLSARRDLANDRRKLRITYLLEAYRRLEAGSNRSNPEPSRLQLESAIADVQLLGSSTQVTMAREFARKMAQDSEGSLESRQMTRLSSFASLARINFVELKTSASCSLD